MLEPTPESAPVPLSREALTAPFDDACKGRERYRLGTEAEKFGVLTVDKRLVPLPFDGERSVKRILSDLAGLGHTPVTEYADGEAIALRRGDASITLEPAAQLELSGAPLATVQQAASEIDTHLQELHQVSEPLGVSWLSLGFHPLATHDQLPHLPKLRYRIMEAYLPTRGSGGLDMMRRTCTVQVNLDYDSPTDAMRKLRVALALQPITTAAFANSPFYEGAHRGLVCERANAWVHMDPDRSGLLPFAWHRSADLQDYVEWALDVPMFMVKRGARVIENTGQTFRQFMADGHSGATATAEDWETHLNTLFPEVRLKRTLEVRGADAQDTPMTCALPALWKGLLYDPAALDAAETLVENITATQAIEARPDVARNGLRAKLAGRSMHRWAEAMVDIAERGLERLQSDPDIRSDGEARYLAPLKSLIEQGLTPADRLLAKVGANPAPMDLLDACRV